MLSLPLYGLVVVLTAGPVLALALGALINNEHLTGTLLAGAALIVLALALHIYGVRWVKS